MCQSVFAKEHILWPETHRHQREARQTKCSIRLHLEVPAHPPSPFRPLAPLPHLFFLPRCPVLEVVGTASFAPGPPIDVRAPFLFYSLLLLPPSVFLISRTAADKRHLTYPQNHPSKFPLLAQNRNLAFQEAGRQAADRPPGDVRTQGLQLSLDVSLRGRWAGVKRMGGGRRWNSWLVGGFAILRPLCTCISYRAAAFFAATVEGLLCVRARAFWPALAPSTFLSTASVPGAG